jgi:hypothetical protein
MARVSKDSDSWKASGIKRRDFRNVHNGPEVNTKGKKKNTRKWCRGKTGKEHRIIHQPHPTFGKYGTHIDRCDECGKEVNCYWPGWTCRATPNRRCEGCPPREELDSG